MRLPALVTILAVVLVACGGETTDETTTTDAPATTSSSIATTTTTTPLTTTTAGTTTTSPRAPLVEIAGGQVTGPEEIVVELGETVEVRVLSDIDDELHVHGYDLVFDLEAGVPLDLGFVADVPGIFEVEVHTGHTHLFEIRVVG